MLGVVEGGINVGANFSISWFNYSGPSLLKKLCSVTPVMLCVFDCHHGEPPAPPGPSPPGINCHFSLISTCRDGNHIRGTNHADVVAVEEDLLELGVVARVVEFCHVFEDHVCLLSDPLLVWNGKEDGKVGLRTDVIIEADEGAGEF